MARIQVTNPRYTYNFDKIPGTDTLRVSNAYYFNNNQTHGSLPDTLFTHQPGVIEGAFAHPSMRWAIPTMIARAHKVKGPLMPSGSLSKHSSPLAQKGIRMGMLQPNSLENEEADVTNDIDWQDAIETSVIPSRTVRTYYEDNPALRRLTHTDLLEAKQHLRKFVRRQKPHIDIVNDDQFEHLKLPGME